MSTAPHAPTKARPLMLDVQGLRAIAVLAVLMVHSGLPVPGGFIGVDIFFVISGFIITLMLVREREKYGRINFVQFYVRRLKRLGPALAATSIVTALLSFLFLSPLGQQQSTYQTILGATFGVGNAVIALTTGDYFGTAAEKNAMLHTWSLAVEEQFYLVLPLLMAGLIWLSTKLRAKRIWFIPFLFLGLTASLSLYSVRLGYEFPLGYYGPVTRAWEFLAGCLLALVIGIVHRIPKALLSLGGLAGVALIIVSCFIIDAETPFPGKMTLLPVAGSLLLLAAGRRGPTLVSRGLSTKPMVAIGDWSYSLYLWHWPLIVVAKAIWPFSSAAPIVAAIVSVVPAYLSYRFIEQPFRRMDVSGAKAIAKLAFTIVTPPTIITLAAWAALIQVIHPAMAPGGLLASRFQSTEQPDPELGLRACRNKSFATEAGVCGTTLEGEPTGFLIGDSHAEHLVPAFRQLYPNLNLEVITVRSPKPFGSPQSASEVAAYIAENAHLEFIVYSRALGTDGGGLSTHEDTGLRVIAEGTAEAGIPLFIADDNPLWPLDMFSCNHRQGLALGQPICAHDRQYFQDRMDHIEEDLAGIAQDFSHVQIVSFAEAFCDDVECRRANEAEPLYSDADHLTRAGATLALEHAIESSADLRRLLEHER